MEPKQNGAKAHPDTAGRVMTLMSEVALEKGLDALSMRDVAKRAGISLAALQYHFPSKDVLIAAFVDAMLNGYRKEINVIRSASDQDEELRNTIIFAVSQTLDVQTGSIFAMLEVRAIHDKSTAQALDGFMRFYLGTVCDVLLRRHPDLPLKDAQLAAASIVAMIEGLSSVRAAAQAIGLTGEDLYRAVATVAEGMTLVPKQ
ncbi:TetR/AcrR family transcriptional regulator [Devosia sp.]|jgi:AcrR family transcriptional regulator|uniref:TetR/AcrR family transcriptional regulator n=1 Tax=Devosia sp. TaxID=1871048 RepID=UPI0037BE833C